MKRILPFILALTILVSSITIPSYATETLPEENLEEVQEITEDLTGPTFTLNYDENWSQSKVVTIENVADESGLSELPYRFNNGEWTNENSFSITENGTYLVEVQDSLGNSSLNSVVIDKIDTTLPVINSIDVIGSQVTINASDNESGICGYRISTDEGISWGDWVSELTFEVSQNGNYLIQVKDNAGNIADGNFEVLDIEDSVISVNIEYTQELVEELELNVLVEEEVQYRFSNDGEEYTEWSSINTYLINENGTYYVEVKDLNDNVYSKVVEITNIIVEENLPEEEIIIPEEEVSSWGLLNARSGEPEFIDVTITLRDFDMQEYIDNSSTYYKLKEGVYSMWDAGRILVYNEETHDYTLYESKKDLLNDNYNDKVVLGQVIIDENTNAKSYYYMYDNENWIEINSQQTTATTDKNWSRKVFYLPDIYKNGNRVDGLEPIIKKK